VDGVKIWDNLNLSQKNFFLKHQVIYKVRVDLGVSNTRKNSPWYIPEPGCFDVTLNGVDSTLEFSMVRSLVNKCSKNKLAFCNYLLHNPWEPQIVTMDMFPDANYFEAISKTELESILLKNQVAYSWNKGDLLMIDNKRFMHARESYNKSTSRVLELIQVLELRN
jgi:alpha-ketoglutarate-dependent taurine dioxygenase